MSILSYKSARIRPSATGRKIELMRMNTMVVGLGESTAMWYRSI